MVTTAANNLQENGVRAVSSDRPIKIAIACSGLGHISRGIETWAADMGTALTRAGADATLFQGAGTPAQNWQVVIRCKRRFDRDVQAWAKRLARLGGWRYGCASGYQIEQSSFSRGLWPKIRREYDILHVQDPWIAYVFERLHKLGLSKPQVILAHGTEEGPEFLSKFTNLQHLAPCYLDDWGKHCPPTQRNFAVPNFVDIDTFRPGDQQVARAAWQLPKDHIVVLCVAAIKKHHKRIDYLIQEFARFADQTSGPATLVVAGGRETQTDEVIAMGREMLGDRVRFLEGVPRVKMPSLFQAADIFTLASLHEMMPIALLEALSSGLPVACNDTPTLRWMAGPAGQLTDISKEGALADQLARLASGDRLGVFSANARAQAESQFSEAVVIEQIRQMYREIVTGRAPAQKDN
ncbi:MAG TPA: glycosyltransferase family 4 protein [Capsulimonadaceae bacterium]|nr:glycosyltransferase family 4 protein [Capsulimonadaceae bacterium]